MPDSESERSLIGALAAEIRWSRVDKEGRREGTRAAREAWALAFEKEVDPEGLLDPDERAMRARNLRRAHLLRMSLKSVESRRQKKLDRLRTDDDLSGGAA